MKYIIANWPGTEAVYLFETTIMHAHFARSQGIPRDRIVAAGFVGDSADAPLRCHGQSTSLGVTSRGEVDTEILRRRLKGDGASGG
ncbi:MAG: hypothetical protein H7840_04075 [Alphaproteobacteria bacterium]